MGVGVVDGDGVGVASSVVDDIGVGVVEAESTGVGLSVGEEVFGGVEVDVLVGIRVGVFAGVGNAVCVGNGVMIFVERGEDERLALALGMLVDFATATIRGECDRVATELNASTISAFPESTPT